MNHTIPFNQLSKKDADKAGGKGASLGEMTQAGIPVPPGFVVSAQTFEYFIKETDLIQEIDAILDTVDHNTVHTVENASEKIQALIHNATMPDDIKSEIEASFKELNTEFVAVRSSATAEDGLDHAWAGQLDSYLNVTTTDVVSYVQKCWASLFTPRAIFYRFEKELNTTHISVAVVVQKMVNSDISGIAFSVHPVTENRNQLIIEAGFGLGEAIVSGQITPDSYVVEKKEKNILDTNINTQNKALYRKEGGGNEWKEFTETEGSRQVLTEEQILELSELIKKIETHYDVPQDIEWAMEGGRFYIVQSRPITTLSVEKEAKKEKAVLSKEFTREHTLFYASAWREGNCTKQADLLGHNIEKVLFLNPDKKEILEVWYSPVEYKQFHDSIVEKIENNDQWFNQVCKKFEDEWSVIESILGLEEISLKKLEKFYEHWVEWWTPLAIIMQIPEIESLSDEIKERAFGLREKTQENSDKGDEVYYRCIEKVYPHLSKYYSVLSPEEVFTGNFSEKELEDRCNGWFMTSNIFGQIKDLQTELNSKGFSLGQSVHDNENIKGNSAYGGKISGKVKVVKTVDDLDKVKDRDIIVTPMTDPRYVPVLKKVSAIITDEGGITCHAAIVAREIKKPCIIGTKFATQVLKDGDEVEVDADNGVVRILNKDNLLHFKKLIKISAPLSLVELHYLQESVEKEPWSTDKFTVKPYICYERKNDEVNFYYDPVGVEWQMNQAGKYKDERYAIEQIKKHFQKVKDILLNEKALLKPELDIFLEDIRMLWPWLNYMWWAIEYREKKGEDYSELMKVRKETEYFTPGIFAVLKNSVKAIYPNKEKYAEVILLNELLNDSVPDDEMLEKRLQGYAYTNNKLYDSWSDLLNDFPVEIIESSIESSTEQLQGQKAYPGKVIGKVRIIKDRDDLPSFQKDEILVAGTTSPDFLPAMKKSAAIISEHGGVICHAAITSRELEKPCVVGIENATTILKDGDEVEVDADNGIVKILSNNKKLINPEEWQFEFQQRDSHPPIMVDLWLHSLRDSLVKELQLDIAPPDYLFNASSKGYIKKKTKKELLDKYSERMKKDEKYQKYIYKRSLSVMEELDEVAEHIISETSKGDDVDLLRLWNMWEEKLLEAIPWFYIPWYLTEENIISDRVKNGLAKHKKEIEEITDFNNALGLLLFPTKEVEFQKEERVLFELVGIALENKDYVNDKNFKIKSEEYLNKFSWMKTFVCLPIEPLSLEGLIEKVEEAIKTKSFEEYKLRAKKKIKNSETVKKLLDLLKDDKELMKDIGLAQELGWILTAAVELALFAASKLIPFNKKIAEKLNINYEDWTLLRLQELKDGLTGKNIVTVEELEERKISYSALLQNKEIQWRFGDEAKEFTEYTNSKIGEIKETIDEIKGQPAFPGKVKGVVLIATSPSQTKGIKEGDILVTSMTSPDYVPAMRKAGAVVTDEGGLLSHAAIISRELEKPCVVGTKFGTQILKDGDEVKVDADNGIVKIINK